MKKNIPLCIPNLTGNESKYLQNCIKTTFVSSVGEYVNSFEEMLKNNTGYKYACAVSSGTTALHLSLDAVGAKHDELVIVPTYSFIASANAVTHTGASPFFVDIDKETLNVDLDNLDSILENKFILKEKGLFHIESKKRLAAIMPVFCIGQPISFEKINEFQEKWNIPMVIDAAGAIGCESENKKIGHIKNGFSTISFNGNKTFTCGGGGALLTNDEKLFKLASHKSKTARASEEYIHDMVGFNYRMTNIQAALGVAQLERFEEFISKKIEIFNFYEQNIQLENIKFINLKDLKSSRWLSFFLIQDSSSISPEYIFKTLNKMNIESKPFWVPLHLQPPYKSCLKELDGTADKIYKQIIVLPSSTNLTLKDQRYVVEMINKL